jgi:hypothetical protein
MIQPLAPPTVAVDTPAPVVDPPIVATVPTPATPSIPIYQLVPPKTTKDKWMDFLYYHWQVVLIIGLCVGTLTLYNINVDTNKQIKNLQSLQTVAKTIDALDAKLDIINQHNKDLYPTLDAKIADLEQARLQFKAAEAKLKQPTKKDTQYEIDKFSDIQISNGFNALGFPTILK